MGEILRRIRISDRACLKNASRCRKLGKTNLRKIEKNYRKYYIRIFQTFQKCSNKNIGYVFQTQTRSELKNRALGPENLTIWVNFYVESEFRVENA